MPITAVTSDVETLTVTIIGDYPVPVERLWEAYSDPRQLEQFWGPETWPATFTRHDMTEGGRSQFHMTGPDGSTSHGWWRFVDVEPHRRIELEDGFAHEDGGPNEAMPTMRIVFTFEPTPTGSRFTSVTHFPSVEAMERLLEMGMVEGLRSALGQLDGVLWGASSRSHSSTEQGMELGAFSVSLAVKDLQASRNFYEKLGFTRFAGDPSQNWLILKNGDCVIGIFEGMFDKNLLTFNPGWDQAAQPLGTFVDVRELQRRLRAGGVVFVSEADESSTGPASFVVVDPDGNPILVDQHV